MYTTAIFIAVITGLTAAIKLGFKISDNFLPLLSIILGIGLALLGRNGFEMGIQEIILYGIILGLASCGLFSGLETAAYAGKQILGRIKK